MPRIVVYAEGAGETGSGKLPAAPGQRLVEESLGPAHVLVRRCLEGSPHVNAGSIVFEAPLRAGARIARGSDLLDRKTIRRLLTWGDSSRTPHLAVVLVDRDGDTERKPTLLQYVSDLDPIVVRWVIGVAVEEFEAWLISDLNAVRAALGVTVDQTRNAEHLKPRETKQLLATWTAGRLLDEPSVRLRVAETCELSVVSKESKSFETFWRDLRHVFAGGLGG